MLALADGFGRLAAKPLKGPGSAEETGSNWTKSIGITGDDAAAAKAMRALSFEDLRKGPLPLGSVGPIADGHLITGTSLQEFTQGKQAKIPYILGGNSDEASLTRSTTNVQARLTQAANDNAFATAFGPVAGDQGPRAVARVVTDELISEPDRALARIHSKGRPPGSITSAIRRWPIGRRCSACRMAARSATSSTTRAAAPFDARARPRPAANAYWVAFAKTGNPASAGGPAWPKWDNAEEPLMEFGRKARRTSTTTSTSPGWTGSKLTLRNRGKAMISKRILIGAVAALTLVGATAVNSQPPAGGRGGRRTARAAPAAGPGRRHRHHPAGQAAGRHERGRQRLSRHPLRRSAGGRTALARSQGPGHLDGRQGGDQFLAGLQRRPRSEQGPDAERSTT